MSAVEAHDSSVQIPLRLWPAVVILGIQWGAFVVLPAIGFDDVGVLVAMGGAALIILWWLLASRAKWSERFAVLGVAVAAVVVISRLVDPSIATGAMGRLAFVLQLPFVAHALVAGALVASKWPGPRRLLALCAFVVAGCCGLLLLRTEGVRSGGFDLSWRWTDTPEERLLARGEEPASPVANSPGVQPAPGSNEGRLPPAPSAAPTTPAVMASSPATPAPPLRVAWPGFRGAERDGRVPGVRIATDWNASPPVEIWRRLIGPGWSSFAVAGGLIFTQEQRGEDEVVAAYRFDTGAPVWRHRDKARFFEGNAGPGPRSTPTVHAGRVYSMGATGIVNALDARTGAQVWTRNAETDTGAPRPGWGFTASPIVVDDMLVAATSGRLIAYDLATGEPRWKRSTGGGGYSSPHLASIGGVRQILLLNGGGITSVSAADGTVLWESKTTDGASIVQPAFAAPSELLIAAGDMMGGTGIRRVAVQQSAGSWRVEERWTSRGLKPYFSDFVVHDGHAYGFDGNILSCIELASGERRWKGGRYGSGQMTLLPEQNLLLVMSEDGEVVLVSATPDQHREISRFKALDGKTWNHPVLVGDVLLVRNGEEMAAFRLAREQ
jgi:outer membrane protein assembly factor BamB